jgi:hypothetical protein
MEEKLAEQRNGWLIGGMGGLANERDWWLVKKMVGQTVGKTEGWVLLGGREGDIEEAVSHI